MHGTEKALGAISEFHCSCRLAAPRKVQEAPRKLHPFSSLLRHRYPNSSLNSTIQKGDSPSHQNVGKYMEY
jgi:hypothetical protein